MTIAGDGWGECPAVVGSGEGDSPEDVSGGCGAAGSLELSSSSSNTTSNPLDWARSINHLLEDPAGVSVFMNFLREEKGCSNALEFFFACKGLEKQGSEQLKQLLPLIWKKFIRNYNVRISTETHAEVAEKILHGALSSDMFHMAQSEVFETLRQTTYPAFLQSHYYLEQLQHYHTEPQDLDVDETDRGYQSNMMQQNVGHISQCYNKPEENYGYPGVWNRPANLSTVYEHETVASAGAADFNKHLHPRSVRTDEEFRRVHLSPKILAASASHRAAAIGGSKM